MRRFAALFEALDGTAATNAKVAALRTYLEQAPPADAAWALWFLSGRRLKRVVGPAQMLAWLAETGRLPAWLVEECHAQVGDLAETVALLQTPAGDPGDEGVGLAEWVSERVQPLASLPEEERRQRVTGWWRSLPATQCFLLNKLLTGALRVGVSRGLVVRAVAEHAGLERATVQQRMTGHWQPSAAYLDALVAVDESDVDASRPYPFFLASPLESAPEQALGERAAWLAEWKWDGIRAQLVRRGGETWIWSRGEELVGERFPELLAASTRLADGVVLDGEILGWRDGAVLPFAALQRRLNRKTLGAKLLAEVPVRLLAYDCLESEGHDRRGEPLERRRGRLEALLAATGEALAVSPLVAGEDWRALAAARESARERGVEGLMLKRLGSAYAVGRPRGDWWKWKVAPHTVDAVLVYAQAGHGRRAGLHTDYTFAVRDGDALVPVAKAYSGLTDAEIAELDRWVRANTLERFGPVRSVTPRHVFELAFEGIAASPRHKSGIALRFPRIARWRRDLGVADADTLAQVKALLPAEG